MYVTFSHNFTDIEAKLDECVRNEIPRATKGALDELAFTVREKTVLHMWSVFELRSAFSTKGIQVEKAQLKRFPLYAEVGVEEKRAYLVSHTTGALKRPKLSSRLSVPIKGKIKRGRGGAIPLERRPKQLLAKKLKSIRYFMYQPDTRHVFVAREQVKTKKMDVLYSLPKVVGIRKQLPIKEMAERIVKKNYLKVFGRNLAMNVARTKRKTAIRTI